MEAGVRARIIAIALAPALVAGLGMVVLLGRDHAEALAGDMSAQVRLEAERWREPMISALETGRPGALGALVRRAAERPGVGRIEVRDGAGRLLASATGGRPPGGVLDRLGHLLAAVLHPGDALLAPVRVPLLEQGPRGAGSVVAAWRLPAGTYGQRLIAALAPALGLLAGLLVVTLLSAMVLASSLTSPLRRLIRQAARLESGDLEAQVRSSSGGELGELERASNRMARALRAGQEVLQNQVRETTSELRQTLQGVEVQNVELDVARKRALEANKVKSEFLANVSHEVRTPINGIVGFADLLYHSPLDAEQRDYVNTIRESCTNLLTIVNDILDFSKIEAGKLVIDNIAFDLRDSVEEVLSLLAPAAYGKSLELVHLIYSDVPLKLYGDPIRIRQVLTNLVHNAIKFTPSGRIVVRVMLEDEAEQDAVLRVTVTDSGIGLSPENQDKLFQAFSQADTSLTRRFGGTGLGLIISRKLLQQMDGEIGLESVPDEGSTFWFTLRLQKQPGGQADEDRAWKNPLAGRRALILDQEPLSRLALTHLLESWDMVVHALDDAARFEELAAAPGRWEILIAGFTRAELNARAPQGILSRLRSLDLPLVVMASTVDRNELRSLYQRGARVCLPKAVRRQTVFRELCRLVAPESAPALSARRESTVIAADRPSRISGRAVLVVDDNEINRKLVSRIASRAGGAVVEARDGRSAVNACRDQRFDVVFMDIHMPGISGEAATREIHRLYAGEAAPRVVALTANAMPGERERLLAAGMDDCLIKPVTEQQVLAAMNGETVPASQAEGPSAFEVDVREDLASMLAAELPSHRSRIRQAYRRGDNAALREAVHKLHGAVAVCDLPDLRSACRQLEERIAADDRVSIPPGIERVMTEIAVVLGPDESSAISGR